MKLNDYVQKELLRAIKEEMRKIDLNELFEEAIEELAHE